MRKISYEEALNRIAERTNDNIRELRKSRLQRRTEFTDLYGVPFGGQSDSDNAVKFYISVSPDLVYFLRFQFKLHIQSYKSSVTGVSGSSGTISGTQLEVDPIILNNTSTAKTHIDGVKPNSHTHSFEGGSGSVEYGSHSISTSSDTFTIKINGVNVTDYLIAQHEGEWIDGEGVYPNKQNIDNDDFYDIMAVATELYNEGNDDDADKLLKPGFKLVEIASDAKFRATMYLYCKYSVTGR